MPVKSIPQEELVDFLRARAIFQDLDYEALSAIGARMGEYRLPAANDLFLEGDAGYTFYIIYDGQVSIWTDKGGTKKELALMENGDKFGEGSLLNRRTRSASISTTKNTIFLTLDTQDFKWMMRTYPQTKHRLEDISQSYRKSREEVFKWLGKNEYIQLITQRHEFSLYADIWKPVGTSIGGILVGLLFFIAPTTALKLLALVAGGLLLGGGISWSIWEWFDWSNDYFIITNQRVVWLEKVALLSESRQESPMSAIQSINVTTDQWGRSFGYGNVEIRTFTGTGSLILTMVNDPDHFKRQIEELLIRVRTQSQSSKDESMRHSIRHSLGFAPQPYKDPLIGLVEPDKDEERSLGLFTTREVDELETITYHKHPWVLLTRIIVPIILLIPLIWASGYYILRDYQSVEPVFPSMTVVAGLGIPLLLVLLGYIWYQYADWSNDLYQLSRDTITDIDRKPFGQEETKIAPLKNVQSINYNRDGLINILLNMGDVHIVVADETLTFDSVHHPSHVQQDIFYRLERVKHDAEMYERERESVGMLNWLKVYHQVVTQEGVEENLDEWLRAGADPDAEKDDEDDTDSDTINTYY